LLRGAGSKILPAIVQPIAVPVVDFEFVRHTEDLPVHVNAARLPGGARAHGVPADGLPIESRDPVEILKVDGGPKAAGQLDDPHAATRIN
jgi:hypothetical protein